MLIVTLDPKLALIITAGVIGYALVKQARKD